MVGLRELTTAAPARSPRWLEFAKFSIVGSSGVVVNLGAYYLLTRGAGLSIEVASPLAIELSVLWNFVLNDCWTFGDRQVQGGPLARLLRFHTVSLFAGIANYVVLLLLTRAAGWWDISANLFAITVAAGVKFGASSSWTWREQEAP
jgi:dolichol-phosphate mannosyltransferase